VLYETLNQPRLFVIFICFGIICGLIFDIGNFIKFLCANKKFACVFIDLIQTSLSLGIIFYVNLKYNYGLFRLYPYIIYGVAFAIERFTLGKVIAKIYLVCYNFFVKIKNKLWRKSKNAQTDKNS